MDEEKKDDELEKKNEEKSESEETANSETKEKEYVPEQLDDDDFEKEKEQAKKEKKEKKKKKSEEIEYDENGNPIAKKKKGKLKIVVIIILLIIIAVGGTIAYLVINPNNEKNFFSELMIESLIKDYAIYINNEEWENVDNCLDANGFAAFYLIYIEENYEEYINSYFTYYGYDEFKIKDKISYIDYDKILSDLETYCSKVEEECSESFEEYLEEQELLESFKDEGILEYFELQGIYEDLNNFVNYVNVGNFVSGYELWSESEYAISDIEIDNIKNISRAYGTESLYKVTVVYSYANSDSITENLYISRVDGNYKIVGGNDALGFVQFNAYYYGISESTDAE